MSLKQGLEDAGVSFEFIDRAPELEADVATQMNIIEDMITIGVDYLIIGPSDFWGVVPAIKKANEAGIPTMICAYLGPYTPETGVDILSYFGESSFLGGQVTGEWVWDQGLLKPGDEFALILAESGNKKSEDRGSAGKIWEERGAKLVYTHYGRWEMDQGYTGTERILAAYPNVKAIYGISSAMAMGAASALDAAGKTGQVDVYGFGCVISELDMIWEGLITASGFRDPASSGRDMANAIVKHLNGEEVPEQHPLNFVMISSREDILEKIPLEQLKLMDNWPEIEKELNARKK
jgi:ribose transport system substrate-binding protein